MSPLVPGVRVGDVLSGTRILRHWLRSASIWRIFYTAWHNRAANLPPLYTPSKSDAYVIVANTGEAFSVWNKKDGTLITFVNPIVPYDKPHHYQRMNPSLFSSWFVRTEDRTPDVMDWDERARFAWLMLQMECGTGRGELALPTFGGYHSSSMEGITWNPSDALVPPKVPGGPWSPDQIKSWMKKVRPRPGAVPADNSVLRHYKNGAGPSIQEIEFFETDTLRLKEKILERLGGRPPRLEDFKGIAPKAFQILAQKINS